MTIAMGIFRSELVLMVAVSFSLSGLQAFGGFSMTRVVTNIGETGISRSVVRSKQGAEWTDETAESFAAESDYVQMDAKDTDVTDVLDVVVNLSRIVSSTSPKFVGVTLDSSVFRRKWRDIDVTSKRLQSLAKGLAPSCFRVGGSAADFFIFNETAGVPPDDGSNNDFEYDDLITPLIENYTVTGNDWMQLQYFVEEAGWDLMFDVNEFQRRGNTWDPDNARALLSFSQQQNFSIPFFQIGNEPNSYHHNFNFSIPGSTLASDMQRLRTLLSEFPSYNKSSILGPDVTKVTKTSASRYLENFLRAGGAEIVSAVTLHHYYFNAKEQGASLKDFINITILDSLKHELSIGASIAHSLAPGLPLWLSETSSVSGGGLAGVSNGFAAGFMWLDKLGLSALAGLQTVLRQSFLKGNYALVADDFTPYPDYFLTLLYKRLVQGPVFNVTTATDSVRIYASCANPSTYSKGAITMYVLNVREKPITLNLTQFNGQQYELYLLTPGDERGLRAATVALNGQKLAMDGDDLPPLPPLLCTGHITFPAYSFGFVVIPHADVKLC